MVPAPRDPASGRLFKNQYVLSLESLLILFILVHGLNGLRLALVENGIGVRRQKTWFTAAMAVSAHRGGAR